MRWPLSATVRRIVIAVGATFLLLLISPCRQTPAQTLRDRINWLASQPGDYGSDLQAKVMDRAAGIAPQNRPYIFNGVEDCWGYVRQVWNAILLDGSTHAEDYYPNNYDNTRWLGLSGGLLTGDAPNSDWKPIGRASDLVPGDLLSTDQGHAWGPDWHGGIFAGGSGSTLYDWDCSPYTYNGGGDGAYRRTLWSGFKYYYQPIHDLLSKSSPPPNTTPPTVIFGEANKNKWLGPGDINSQAVYWNLQDAGGGLGGFSQGWDSDPGGSAPQYPNSTGGWLSFASIADATRERKHTVFVKTWNSSHTQSQVYPSTWYGYDATNPIGAIDSPQPNAAAIGTYHIAGWALDPGSDPSGVKQVQLLLDGGDMGAVTYPESRADGNPGFHLDWDSSGAAIGAHTITLHIIDNANNSKDISVNFTVARGFTLLRAQGESTVFLISNGKRRAFPTADCFDDWQQDWNNVQVVPRSTVDSYAWDVPIPHLIRTTDPTVYYIQDGYRRAVTGNGFAAMGFSFSDVVTVTTDRLNHYPQWNTLDVVEPRLIVVDGPILSLPTQRYIGNPVTVRFKVRNIANVGSTVQGMLLSVHGPDGSNDDFPISGSVTLNPNDEYTYTAQRTLPLAGRYTCSCAFVINNDQWHSAPYSGLQPEPLGYFDVLPTDPVTSVTLSPSSVTGGTPSTGTVNFGGPAPSGGFTLSFSSDNTNAAIVPGPMNITAGASSATFTVTTKVVSNAATANITATYNGSTSGAALSINPVPAPPPPSITLSGGSKQVTVAWTSSPGATSYNVRRSVASGGPYTIVPGGANVNGTYFIDTGLTNGLLYYYVVSAVGSGGESANSNQVSVIPASTWIAMDTCVGIDSKARVLWDNNDGRMAVWSIDNAGVPTYGPVYGPYPGYTARAIASGRDGLTWVLWNKNDGTAAIWLVGQSGGYNNALEASFGFGPYPGWTAVDISVGIDSKARVLWTHTDGRMIVWSIDNSGAASYGPSYGPYPGYTARRISCGSDGLTWVLWNKNDGTAAIWLMGQSGAYNNIYEASFGYGPYPGWTASDITAGSDARGHVLWKYTDGQMSVWGLDNTGHAAYGPIYGSYTGFTPTCLCSGSDGIIRALWNNTDGSQALWLMGMNNAYQVSFGYGPY